mgnify:CR=1 FL=1
MLMKIWGRLWTGARARKVHTCRQCEGTIALGEPAYRAFAEGGGIVRNDRLCETCAKKLGEELK